MDVLDLPLNIKNNLSSLLFNDASETRDHALELLSNYSLDPLVESRIISFSCNGRTQYLRAKSVLVYCESNDLEDTASYRVAWHTVSSFSYSEVFGSNEPDW